jgi:hypothetical protein
MKSTLLPTKVFHLFDGPGIYVSTMEESVHKYYSCIVVLRARMAFLYSFANSVAVQSSNLGIVGCFNGVTLDVEHKSLQDVLLLLSVERMYRQAP